MSTNYIELIKSDDNIPTIVINGEFTVNNAEEMRQEILPIFEDNETLNIKLTEIENLDLAGIQVLYSLNKTAKNSGKTINFTFDISEEQSEVIKNSGFDLSSL